MTTSYILGSTITSNDGVLLVSLINDGEEDGYTDSSLCVRVSFSGSVDIGEDAGNLIVGDVDGTDCDQ